MTELQAIHDVIRWINDEIDAYVGGREFYKEQRDEEKIIRDAIVAEVQERHKDGIAAPVQELFDEIRQMRSGTVDTQLQLEYDRGRIEALKDVVLKLADATRAHEG